MTQAEEAHLSLEVWDHTSLALLNALDTRDVCLSLSLITLLVPITHHVGRAAILLQKSPKFPSFMCLQAQGWSLLRPVPVQSELLTWFHWLFINPKPAIFQSLVDAGVIKHLIDMVQIVSSSMVSKMCLLLERVLEVMKEFNCVDMQLVHAVHEAICVRLKNTDTRHRESATKRRWSAGQI